MSSGRASAAASATVVRNRSQSITVAIAPNASCFAIVGGDQRGANTRIEADLLVDGASISLEGACMPTFGLAEHRADQPVKQIDGLVGQVGGRGPG